MPRKHKCPEPEPDNSKAWLDSYADAMTLLLAFFILLFAFSLVDQKKFQEFKAGIHLAAGKAAPTLDGGDGILELGSGISSEVIVPPVLINGEKADIQPKLSGEVGRQDAEALYEELTERIEQVGATEFVELERTARGVVVRMDSQVLYQSGSAKILPDGVTILTAVAPVLNSIDNEIEIEGHTDNQPTGSFGETNWELSGDRAAAVLRYLNVFGDIPSARMSIRGFADIRPRESNTTEEGRAANRRVEIVVLIDSDEIELVDDLIDTLAPDLNPIVSDESTDLSDDIEPEAPVIPDALASSAAADDTTNTSTNETPADAETPATGQSQEESDG